MLERSVLEGALSLAREGCGQTLFVARHGPHSLADRRINTIEVKAIDPNRPLGLVRDLLRAAIARPEARSAAARLPADLTAYLKTAGTSQADPSAWPAAIGDFFAALSERAPLMIVLDQAQRADAGSCDLIDALARRVSASRILLIVTYRIDTAPNARLDQVMRLLLDARLARSMVIAAPHADEVRLLFQSVFGRDVRPDAAAASLAEDEPAVLMHGLTVVEACRRAGRWPDAKAAAERIMAAGEAHHAPYVTCSAAIAIGHVLADQG
ncbi:MAG: AAA family ATPase, partial [Dongiaceae bacterium]